MRALVALALALPSQKSIAPPETPNIALVVVLTVDQLRPDYLARYGPQFRGGLRALLDRGILYDRARQNHAITETAPGHATLLSGREPASTGIMNNELGVGDSTATLLAGDPQPGASPRRFRGSALYDWLLAADPGTRLLSVSRKDRGAILPVGRARAPVFWWAHGRFTTSRYYADTLPSWVRAFDARQPAARLAGATWDLLLPPEAYPEPDAVAYEHGGHDVTFPHRLPGRSRIADEIQDYPWMDSLTLAFALEGTRALGLGRRSGADLLLVSLSTTDDVGHAYGPDSREIHDQILRLDRWLGWFFDSLAATVPSSRTLVVLSADHGVQSFPQRVGAGRVWLGDLERAGWRFGSGLLSADTLALAAKGQRVDQVAESLAGQASSRRGIARVYTPATLAAAPSSDTLAMLWHNSIPPGQGWLIAAAIQPGFVWSRPAQRSAEHGSTAPMDLTVPLVMVGPGIAHGLVHRPVRTVDIAPTLAALLRVRPDERLDGEVLPEIVARSAQ